MRWKDAGERIADLTCNIDAPAVWSALRRCGKVKEEIGEKPHALHGGTSIAFLNLGTIRSDYIYVRV